MQLELIPQVSVKTPLRYFGGKNYATPVLLKFFSPDIKEVVSPFFGSGALELALTGRGVRVHGYDKFPPIPQFWTTLQASPYHVGQKLREIIRGADAEALHEWAVSTYPNTPCEIMRAALMLIIHNVSFNNMGFKGGTQKIRIIGDIVKRVAQGFSQTLIFYNRIDAFYNPLVKVQEADFRYSIPAHPDAHIYADPPYPVSANVYGDSDEYHKDFPHSELAELLYKRDNWTLSYNDVEFIHELYPDNKFDWYPVKWRQGSRGTGRLYGNDVVITPRGQCADLNLPPAHRRL